MSAQYVTEPCLRDRHGDCLLPSGCCCSCHHTEPVIGTFTSTPDDNGFHPELVGAAVVKCPGCGEERWYGYGACQKCGTFLPGATS